MPQQTVPVADRHGAVCVIGAGGTGLAAIKNLRQYGFDVDCYERETGVGGAWNWRHQHSPVYSSTHLISSRPLTQFPDFPMPDDWPDYPHHSQVLAYFERYADHFALREHVWFGTEVVSLKPVSDEPGTAWDVTVRGVRGGAPKTLRYAAVIACNGHNWVPRAPMFDGLDEFRGNVLHASAYKDPAQLRGKKVLVVGGGNSGCDIAVEAAQQAARCWHSTRRGYWYAPKFAFGRPADQVDAGIRGLPLWLRQRAQQRVLKRTVGDLTRLGLPKPDHKILETHPIVNSLLPYYVGHGDITPVPDVKRFEYDRVVFTDGRTAETDVVIFATGYTPRFEFVVPELIGSDEEGRPHLRWQLMSRSHPTLAVAGLLQPDSGVFPLAHWQTVLFAAWLRALHTVPDPAIAWWERQRAADGRRYVDTKAKDSPRHWFEVSYRTYLKTLQKALVELDGVRT